MNRAIRVFYSVCLIAVFSFMIGCGDDPVSTPQPQPQPEPDLAGVIGIFADPAGANPNITDTGGIVSVYVVHTIAQGATASAFKVEAPAGWTLVNAQAAFPLSIGDINDGISIAYGMCKMGVVHIMTLTYDSPGNTAAGQTFKVQPHAQWPNHVQVVDCFDALHNGAGMETPIIVQ
jgi:hypothetical protein